MLVCFACLLLLMCVCGVRVAIISADHKYKETAVSQSQRKATVALNRGTIYDCNNVSLTNVKTKEITVVFPCEQGAVVLAEMLSGEQLQSALDKLAKGNPVVIEQPYHKKSDGAVTLSVKQRYSDTLRHVIGYVDKDGVGISGIEKGFDEVLKGEPLTVTYTTDTAGRMLVGEGYTVSSSGNNSVTLTIDAKIQNIVEDAMLQVERGAAVVVEAQSGKIKAMVSRPTFDSMNIAEYLDNEDSPLINRALYPYNVGSVFKPCVAAAAIENGLENYSYNCTGSITHKGMLFKCNHIAGHGQVDLKNAIAVSCNTFFYTLAGQTGAKSVYLSAEALRFGKSLDLGGGIIAQSGSLPKLDVLNDSSATLINLSIGQGDLMLTPVVMSNLYSAIVNDGSYRLPMIVEGVTVNGKYTPLEESLQTKAMSKKTAEILENHLKFALSEGTGASAYTEGVIAGGKTGTAQTGWKDGERKILNGWFCGFVECDDSDYVIVILKEDVQSSSHDCAPIFKKIANAISQVNIK